jgi:PKD repeat protein
MQLNYDIICLFMKFLFMRYLLIFAFVFSSFYLIAQEDETWKCATDEIYLQLLNDNPEILKQQNELDEFVRSFIANNPKTGEVYIIPVVFHVVHDYGVENISYEQILGAVEQMNLDFRKMRDDTSTIHAAFKSIAADTKIEFRLAKIDPWGECTIGVTRTVSETTFGGGEDAKDAAPTWPPEKYLNVWTVYSLGYGAAGWSYYPGTAPYGSDGIILLHDYVGVSGTSSPGRGSVLTHEAGHYLNLGHPWGHTNDPELAENCDMDDGIEDTPNTIGHTSCNINAITCGSLDNVQNFMEYSYCYKMFTFGQSDVMRAVLNSSVAGRNNLRSQSNLIATGTNDGYTPQICAPIADFKANNTLGCTGFSVQYNDLSYNTDFIGMYDWTFEGGNPSSSDEAYPIVTYPSKGSFDAELYVENPTDSDSKANANYIRVYDPADGYSLPYTENFETSTFPLINGNSFNDFYILADGDRTWEQSNLGFSGKSIKIQNKFNDRGIKNRIYLPNIYIEDTAVPVQVTYKCAYGRSDSQYSDRLKFYLSTACGDSLRIVSIISGSTLTSEYVSSWTTYMPSAEDWKTHTFTINGNYIKSNNLRLVIEAESGGGNAIFIDQVSFEQVISGNSQISAKEEALVYPNPCNDELFLEFNTVKNDVFVSISDYTGKVVSSAFFSGSRIDASDLISNLPAGLYFMKTVSGEKTQTYKLIKN